MPWRYASDGKPYDGPTHELAGNTYSGATRTPESRRLKYTEQKPKTAAQKRSSRKSTIIEE